MGQLFHSFRFPTITRRDPVDVTPLRVALIARLLHSSASSIAGLSCDAGDCLALE